MSDVFISYARSSEVDARRIADALRKEGVAVWWDEDLPAHRAYSDVIEERLKAAKAVLVLWSADAAKSQWVRAEGDAARQDGRLVQLTLDGTMPPMPFNQIQCPSLSGWDGDTQCVPWLSIRRSLADLAGLPAAAAPAINPGTRSLSICVLPFANVSGDAEQEYFSDGMTEDLIIELSRIPGLGVVARNTSFTFKGRSVDVTTMRRQLDVSHVVEGSVRKAASRLRINAELIDTATGHHLWAERYDRNLTDIFDVQDEITSAIVKELKLKLLPQGTEQPRHLPDPVAYQEYLKARHCWNRGTEESLKQAVSLFQSSIEHDPLYARSCAGLADAFVQLGNHTYLDPEHAYTEARKAAEQALKIDPELADAHASLGLVSFVHDWDAAAAEHHLSRAVRLDPASVTARHHFSRVLAARGRFEEALTQARAGVELDPLSVAAAVQLASVLRVAGRSTEAIEQLERAREIFPGEFRVYYCLCFAFASADRGGDAVTAAEVAARVGGRTMFALGALGYAKAQAGSIDEARAILTEMEAARAERYVCPYDIATIYAALGEHDQAFAWLEQAIDVRDHAMLFAGVDPSLASLRADPRFKQVISQVHAIGN